MFSHIVIGANDIAQSKAFYDATLGALGIAAGRIDERGRVIYEHDGGRFILTRPIDGQPATHANGGTIGFHAPSTGAADAWHAAGVAHGGTAIQDPPMGTGHAVRAAEAVLGDFVGHVVVTYGDVPLLKAADIEPVFADAHEGVTVIGFEARDPGAYGRLILDGDDHIGLFAVTAGLDMEERLAAMDAEFDDYGSIMFKALADRLVEAGRRARGGSA